MDDRSAMLHILKESSGCLIIAMIISSVAFYALFSPTEIKYREERAKEEEQKAALDGYVYTRFQLDGHTYISFYRMGSSGVVHDPDCLCWMDSFYGEN